MMIKEIEKTVVEDELKRHLDAGEKFKDDEITPTLAAAAVEYLVTYDGNFEFLLDIHRKFDETDRITGAQVRGVLNCMLADRRRAAGAATKTPLPDVPAGHYAVADPTGHNDLDFFRVDRPTEGKWAGRTFVKKVIGGRPAARVQYKDAPVVLERIAAAGIDDAATLYGREIGRCHMCNRHLTDETSRELGIGPDCRSRRETEVVF